MTTLDPRDMLLADAVLDGDDAVESRVATDGDDLSLGQLGARVVQASLRSAAPLGRTVAVVVALGAEEQVTNVDARGVVAVMENAEAVGDRAMRPLPGEAMGLHPQPTDTLTDVPAGTTLSDGFDARCHDTDPTFGGV